ncbi:hypothetical protein K1719_003355 [Acacia pycnantha]|nr:hypothetical protein K1719_003355 [Acacia pycnantha]
MRWKPPVEGRLKVNVDGAQNVAAGLGCGSSSMPQRAERVADLLAKYALSSYPGITSFTETLSFVGDCVRRDMKGIKVDLT